MLQISGFHGAAEPDGKGIWEIDDLGWAAEAVGGDWIAQQVIRGIRLPKGLGRPSLTTSAPRRRAFFGAGGFQGRSMASFRHSIPFMLSAAALLAERLRK